MLVVLWVDRGCSGLGSFDRISTMAIDRHCRAIDKTPNSTFEYYVAKSSSGEWNMDFRKKNFGCNRHNAYQCSIRVDKNEYFSCFNSILTLYCALFLSEKNCLVIIWNVNRIFIYFYFTCQLYEIFFQIIDTCIQYIEYLKISCGRSE